MGFVVMLRELLIDIKNRYIEDRIYDQSAQLAYYFLFSLLPFLYLAFTLFGFLPISSGVILELIEPYAPQSTYQLIKENLMIILDQQHGKELSISILSTIYLATMMFQSVIRILNRAYRVEKTRPFWKDFLLGIILMTGLLFAIIVSLFLSLYGHEIGRQVFFLFDISPYFFTIWTWIRWLLSTFFIWLAFLTLYVFTPNTKITFKQAFPGALFSTLGWQLSSLSFSYYVSFNDYTVLYGNLGAIIILLLWFYISAMILILGGVLNASICSIRAKKKEKKI